MKHLTYTLLLMLAWLSYVDAQVPQAFSYQAVAFDNQDIVLTNETISIQVSIFSGSEEGDPVYQETHITITDNFGLFDLNIGQGSPALGSFSDIDWGNAAQYLQIAIDENAGTNFQELATSQLLSVPYAFYAATANIDELQLGAEGPQGPEGPIGPPGQAGPNGPQGVNGQAGPNGPAGPQGADGAPGADGPAGAAGDPLSLLAGELATQCWDLNTNFERDHEEDTNQDGFWNALDCEIPGPSGSEGGVGPIGAIGPQGIAGIAGTSGPTGNVGPTGPAGPAGAAGPRGASRSILGGEAAMQCWDLNGDFYAQDSEDINNDGIWNANDCIGPMGPRGAQGPAGSNGPVGATGPQGAQGPAGNQGFNGSRGPKGETGIQGPAGTDALGFWSLSDNTISYAEGKVSIGDTLGTDGLLEVDGAIYARDVYSNGIPLSSDRNYKKDILPIQNALEKLLQLRPVSYKFRAVQFPDMKFPAQSQMGLIAQETEQVFPEIVVTRKDGYKMVDYTKLLPVLLESLKELQTVHQLQSERLETEQAKSISIGNEVLRLNEERKKIERRIEALEQVLNSKQAKH